MEHSRKRINDCKCPNVGSLARFDETRIGTYGSNECPEGDVDNTSAW